MQLPLHYLLLLLSIKPLESCALSVRCIEEIRCRHATEQCLPAKAGRVYSDSCVSGCCLQTTDNKLTQHAMLLNDRFNPFLRTRTNLLKGQATYPTLREQKSSNCHRDVNNNARRFSFASPEGTKPAKQIAFLSPKAAGTVCESAAAGKSRHTSCCCLLHALQTRHGTLKSPLQVA